MEDKLGTVHISHQVLVTIARLTTLSVPGVARMFQTLPSKVDRLLKGKGAGDGVRVEIVDGAVLVDLHIVADRDLSIFELGRDIQTRVSRAIIDMVGMPVLAINVHVEDVENVQPEE